MRLMSRSHAAVFAAVVMIATEPVPSFALQPVATSAMPAETSILNTRHIDFTSRINGHRYSIDVALPFEPMPAEGYKVLYVLDGNGYFASATEAVRANAPGVVVVGIGYPDTSEFIKEVLARHPTAPAAPAFSPPFIRAIELERMYDMTLPASDEALAGQNIAGIMTSRSSDVGGMDDYLKTIETEVKPRVAALTKIDPSNQVLFGHSIGGLTVVHALFTEPNAFRTFIAASPSIWWNNSAVLADEPAFAAKVISSAAHPRVLITVGGQEEDMPNLPPAMAAARPQVEALLRRTHMIGNACSLATRLKALHGSAPYQVDDCAVFAKQAHGISPWPAIGRAVSFAFPG